MTDYGLGRRSAPDPKDHNYLIRSLVGAPQDISQLTRVWWDGRFWPDQGATSQCVEYAWHNYMACRPINSASNVPFWPYGEIYHEAQELDEWPGTDYDGTSVRAGAKALQARGLISNYLWAFTVEDVVRAVHDIGPVVLGTNWYNSMFTPDEQGVVKVEGGLAGGHAYTITAVNATRGLARCKNSWSKDWGIHGRFWLPFEALERLLNEEGEACIATEISV